MLYPELPEANSLQEIGEFEFLPMSEAFRRLVGEHWSKKIITYQSTEPLAVGYLTAPDALSVALSDGQSAVGPINLITTQTKDLFHGEGSMSINGLDLSITLDDLHTSLTWNTAFGASSEATIPTDTLSLMLLNIAGSNGRISDEDKALVFSQSPTTPALLQAVLAKMAMLDGTYTCTTRTIFSNPPQFAYIADLIDGETPNNNASVLNIDLSHLRKKDVSASAEELDSHQKAMLAGPQDTGIVDQHATIIPEGAITPDDFVLAKGLGLGTNAESFYLQPENNFDEWLLVCRTFNRYIQPLLKPYVYLDEEIRVEPVDFDDPDFRRAFPEL